MAFGLTIGEYFFRLVAGQTCVRQYLFRVVRLPEMERQFNGPPLKLLVASLNQPTAAGLPRPTKRPNKVRQAIQLARAGRRRTTAGN